MTENSNQGLAGLDISMEEASADYYRIKNAGNRDGRICICGHAMGFHDFIESRGVYRCNCLKQRCPCKTPRPVIVSSNAKAFLKKTFGSAGLHALTQGIFKVLEDGGTIEWIVDKVCDRCGNESQVVPCPVTQTGRITHEATGWDKLLCRECRASV